MPLLRGRYSLAYRSELLEPMMRSIQRGESVCIVGMAGTGKSNLVHFLCLPEVKAHYLPVEVDDRTHFVPLSCLPGAGPSDHIFLAMTQWAWEIARGANTDLHERPPEAISAFQGLRSVLRLVCDGLLQKLVFVFDEFECLIQNQAPGFLDDLRVLRDDHRTTGNVVFVVLTHRLPQSVRGPEPMRESKFFPLIRDQIYPLPPYRDLDAHTMVDELVTRENCGAEVAMPVRRRLVRLAGGHPGLILSIFQTLKPDFHAAGFLPETLLSSHRVAETCGQIWHHLHAEERATLLELVDGQAIDPEMERFLSRRGLLDNGSSAVFSPVFREYVKRQKR